jgi:PAS domain S-box-containing protein
MVEAPFAALDKSDGADEPIHIPGAIQPHGYLFILNAADRAVMAVSQNLADALKLSPADMVGRPVSDFLVSTMAESLDTILAPRERDMPFRAVLTGSQPLDALDGVVRIDGDVMLLELEASISAELASNLFGQVRTGIERIRQCPSLESACQALANEVRRISGFDRVMVYRFDEDWNGQVVAEDRLTGLQSCLGLAFPASDIPAQARALYLLDTVRLIPDARYRPSPVAPAVHPISGRPFDLSKVTLRSVSPVHLEYLANMGVAASMSVAIIRDHRLWGLVACHHARPRILPQGVLQACDLLAQAAAWYLEANEYAEAGLSLAAVRRLAPDLERDTHRDFRHRLASIGAAVLASTRSDSLAILEPGSVWAIGLQPSDEQLKALAEWLSVFGQDRVVTDRLSGLYPTAAAFPSLASGMVANRLGDGWLVWLRPEWPHSLTRAAGPDPVHSRNAETARINPRKSFEAWRQNVRGRSAPWTVADLTAVDEVQALVLRAKVSDLVAAASRDLGTRKDAEAHLVQMEARYRGLLEAAPDAMVVVNEGGEVVLLNLQAEKRFGYLRDELVGQPVTHIIPKGFAERLISDGERTAAEALAQQIGTGLQLVGRRKDGTEFPIELMLSPLENADGVLVTAAIRDISTRKDAEAHLVQMEARYRGLLEAAPDAMVVVNEGGEVVLLNLQAEKQFGYLRDELVGQPVTDIIPQGFAERLIADGERTAAEALAQQIGTGLELVGRRKDGSEFPIELMLSPLESAEGVLVTAAIRDGTARREAIEALQQRLVLERAAVELARSNDDLQQFAYVAAHDLQEPLRMVSNYTQLLADRYRGRLDASAESYIAFAVDGAQRMQLLIEDLLAYCQIGKPADDLRETSSEDALARALANLRTAIDESGGSVTHDALPILIADPAQLTQLFQNLVGNAIKYRGAEPPHVHVAAKKTPAHEWVFSVADNGLGIEPRYFEKIFMMFQRLHGRSEFSGTGIGLSLCKKIAERHRGRIWVESTPGAGSTFFLALPERREAAR